MARKMSLDDYLISKDVGYPLSDFLLDKLRCNRQIRTQRGKKKFEKECEKHRNEYAEKRRKAIEEYNQLVECGEIIPKTHLDKTIEHAHGHPDNASTQAARRILENNGKLECLL